MRRIALNIIGPPTLLARSLLVPQPLWMGAWLRLRWCFFFAVILLTIGLPYSAADDRPNVAETPAIGDKDLGVETANNPLRKEGAIEESEAVVTEEKPAADPEVNPQPQEESEEVVASQLPVRSYTIRRSVVYKVAGHRQLKGDIFCPKGEGPFPAVLLLHGGAWKAGSRKQMSYHAKRLAPNGYVAFAIDYRLAPRHKFPAQIDDCRDAVRFLRERAEALKIDPRRIAAYGYSAGGHLACLLGTSDGADEVDREQLFPPDDLSPEANIESEDQLAQNDTESPSPGPTPVPGEPPKLRTNSRVQVVVAGGAPCGFEILPPDSQMLAFWLGGTRMEFPMRYRTASPIAFVTSDDAPTLFYHGQNDTLVPMFTATRMHERLSEQGVLTDFYVCPEKGHYRSFLDSDAFQKALGFLDQQLKDPEKGELDVK